MQLTRTLVRELEMNKKWIVAILSNIDRLEFMTSLQEEPGEILITLLMKEEEIQKAIVEAVKEVLGNGVEVSKVFVTPEGKLIRFLISNRS